MIYVLAALLGFLSAGLVAITVVLILTVSAERARWAQERSELLTRISHPEIVPRPANAPTAVHVVPEDEGQLSLVGQILE